MDINKDTGIPKYVQLRDALLREISAGRLKPGDRFHTQNELMDKYKLSFATVTHTLRDMTKAGYFVRVKGQGTFIADHPDFAARAPSPETLFIVGNAFNMADRAIEPASWFVFDEIQKGIVNSYNGPVRFVSLPELLGVRKANAILLNPSQEDLDKLRAAGIVFVAIDHRRELRLDCNSVSWEMLLGIYELMAYLIRGLGHHKIAYIGGDIPVYFADRHAAYAIGLRAHDLPLREEYVIRGLRGSEADGHDAMKRLLALPDRPTAVFADTDLKATGVLRAAHEAGLSVPEDIAIAGFDDMPGLDALAPPLTTVKIPYFEIGAKAVELLLERCENGMDVKAQVLKSQLVIRQSCAKAKEAS